MTSELFTEVEIRSSPYFPRGKKGETSEEEFQIIFNCRHITACGVDYKLESNRLNSGSSQSLDLATSLISDILNSIPPSV